MGQQTNQPGSQLGNFEREGQVYSNMKDEIIQGLSPSVKFVMVLLYCDNFMPLLQCCAALIRALPHCYTLDNKGTVRTGNF